MLDRQFDFQIGSKNNRQLAFDLSKLDSRDFMFDREEAERQEAALLDADDSEAARRIHLAAPKVEIDIASDRSMNSSPEEKKKKKKKALFRRKTIDVIDKSLLLAAMFGRQFKR